MSCEWLLYLRKSVGSTGIARQRTSTTGHLARRDGTVVAEFSDADRTAFRNVRHDLDAPLPKRPGFDEMLAEAARRPGVGLATWHIDRIARDPEAGEILIRACVRGGHLLSTTRGGDYDASTANGRKRIRDDINSAIHEVDHNVERMLEAKTEAAAEGRFLGGSRPFGWLLAHDGVLELHPVEAPLVAAGSLDLLTGVPLSEIARRWTAAGTTGTRGAVWDGRTVGQVLTRARNAALVEHHGQVLGRAQWPAILEEGAWRAVCAVMADPARRTSPGGERRHLLTGVALCGGCGNPLVVNGGGPQPARYLCTRAAKTLPRRPNQIHVGRQVTLVDTAVRALVLARLSRDDAEGLLRADTSGERGNLIIRETELDARYRGQYDLYLAGTIDEVDLARGRKKIKDDLDEVRGRRVALEEADLLALWLSDPEGEWERRSVYDRRAVVETLMMITLMPARRGPRPAGYKVGRSWFNPELIDVRWRRALPSDR